MNWSELNRRLDEPLETEDALLIVQRFGLDADQFPARPTLREIVQAGDLSLGDVKRILDPNSVEDIEPEPAQPAVAQNYSHEYVEAELGLDEETKPSPVHAVKAAPKAEDPSRVIDRYLQFIYDSSSGVTEDEAEWLSGRFGLGHIARTGTRWADILDLYDLDRNELARALAERDGHDIPRGTRGHKNPGRLVDLDDPRDVSEAYDAMQREHSRRGLPVLIGGLIVMGLIAAIASAGQCSNASASSSSWQSR